MKKQLSILRLTGAFLLAIGAGTIGMAAMGSLLGFIIFFLVSLTLSFLPGKTVGLIKTGLSTEVWIDRIEENLYKDNEFLKQAIDDSQYVNNITVHIPNAGAPPAITKNRVIDGTPTNATKREDAMVSYDIAELTSDPFIITSKEQAELSYNKMDSELFNLYAANSERVAEEMLLAWAPTGTSVLADGVTVNKNIMRTSGVLKNDLKAAPGTVDSHIDGTTGKRLTFGMWDVQQMQKAMNKQNISKSDRNWLVDSEMYSQLVSDMSATQYTDFSRAVDEKEGIVGKLYGFTFYSRSTVLVYSNDATPVLRPYGAVPAATDCAGSLIWWTGAVSRAKGQTEMYVQTDNPIYYAKYLCSTLVRAGGAKRRKTEVGVFAMVQGTPDAGV